MRTRIVAALWLGIGGLLTTACGFGSLSPIVMDGDVVNDSRLEGTWIESKDRDSAVITAAGDRTYAIAYFENGGKKGSFEARLGTLGKFRVLDVQPVEPARDASDLYRGLLLRAHSLLVIDSLDAATLRFRMIESDSLRRFLERTPRAIAHRIDDGVLLTAESPEVRRFLATFMSRPGALTEQSIWQRRTESAPGPSP